MQIKMLMKYDAPNELPRAEAVLRTLFCLSQNARGAIVFGFLASELADKPYIDYTLFFLKKFVFNDV